MTIEIRTSETGGGRTTTITLPPVVERFLTALTAILEKATAPGVEKP